MALYEQMIWLHAQRIAATYPISKRAQYRAAAYTLRIPYWDWSTSPTMPPEVSQPTIYIIMPNGTSSVPNPLYNYTFHPLPTVRYPDASGQSQPDLVNKQLEANGGPLHTMTYTLLTQQPNYAIFSNQGYNDGRGTGRYNSIENMHNGIHMFVGNGGHMSNIPYSSFDPIFWLHHANVDRLFALWQAVYPDSNVTSQVNTAGTFTDDPGKVEDVNTRWFSPKISDTTSPFFVHLYLGTPPADPSTWSFAPNLIGSHSVVDNSLLSPANVDLPSTLYGQIPLNHALLTAGNSDLTARNMVPILTSQLNWRLQTTDDVPLDVGKVPSLKIHVVAQEVKPRVSEDEFPEYGRLVVYRQVTEGKAGGLQDGDSTE
ncbi:MAG: hypothetical protein Q9166_003840 [cf. Caloplaca sp. 2 TL-2023]